MIAGILSQFVAYLYRHLRCVVRVAQLGGHVEPTQCVRYTHKVGYHEPQHTKARKLCVAPHYCCLSVCVCVCVCVCLCVYASHSLEVRVVRDDIVTDLDHLRSALFECLFQK